MGSSKKLKKSSKDKKNPTQPEPDTDDSVDTIDTMETENSTDEEEDVSSSEDDDDDEYELHPISREDVSVRESTIPGAGMGVITKRPLKAGSMLPYYTLVKKVSQLPEGGDSCYYSNISYVNKDGKDKILSKMIGDGNPHIKPMKKLPREFRTAPYVNEAYDKVNPNIILVTNPTLTKEQIIKAYRHEKPLATSLLVLPQDVPKGQELLTLYGKDYKRNYHPWKGKKKLFTEFVQTAIDFTEDFDEDIATQFP